MTFETTSVKIFQHTLLVFLIFVCAEAKTSTGKNFRPYNFDDVNAAQSLWVAPQGLSPDGSLAIIISEPRNAPGSRRYLAAYDYGSLWVQKTADQPLLRVVETNVEAFPVSPIWSADGQRLAFYRVGETRTVWIWEKSTGSLKPVIPQRSIGSIGLKQGFKWIDSRHLLCIMLPEALHPKPLNTHAQLVDKQTQFATSGWRKYFEGQETSVNVLESALLNTAEANDPLEIQQIVLVDATTGAGTVIVEKYPIAASDTLDSLLVTHPAARVVAVMHSDSAETAQASTRKRSGSDKNYRLTIHGLDGIVPRFDRPLPDHLVRGTAQWSPDGQELAYLAYGSAHARPLRLVRVNMAQRHIEETPLDILRLKSSIAPWTPPARMEWTQTSEIVVWAAQVQSSAPARYDWWLIPKSGLPRALTEQISVVPDFNRLTPGSPLMGIAEGDLWVLDGPDDTSRNVTAALAMTIHNIYSVPARQDMVVVDMGDSSIRPKSLRHRYYRTDIRNGGVDPLDEPVASAQLIALDFSENPSAVWISGSRPVSYGVATPTALWRSDVRAKRSKKLKIVNKWTEDIAWAGERYLDYTSLNGEPFKGWVRLPLGYVAGRKYPVIVSIYPMGPDAPKHYPEIQSGSGWQAEATAGFAVLIPSMVRDPVFPNTQKGDFYWGISDGVLPAVDKLVELGIADPERLFVEGHSHGGYATYMIVTQTKRFKAAIASAGVNDLISAVFALRDRYGDSPSLMKIGVEQLNPHAVGPSGAPPWNDLGRYLRNSAIFYAERIQTPLLIAHGDMDGVPIQQAEEMFAALWMQKKRATLLRYFGEGHGLHDQPANYRDFQHRRIAWYDEFGDIARDHRGCMIFEGNRVKSRHGAPVLKPEEYTKFDFFGPGGEKGTGNRAAAARTRQRCR